MLNSEPRGWAIFVRLLLFGAFVAGTVVCIYVIYEHALTEREAAMFGVLLTILSTLASWIITDLYGSSQYRRAITEVREEYRGNLRTYALKAAEKVNNLSNELGRLSGYLEH